jgi:putative ABC transport system permease protein
MRPLARGLGIGLLASVFLTRALEWMPGGVKPTDPLTFGSVVLVLSLGGVLGCVMPARRAIRVDPVKALGCD